MEENRSEVFALLLADARLPTGGHTQSAGLEAAMRAGLAADDVPAYLRSRLGTVVRVEAGSAVAARAACAAANPEAGLRAVDAAWRARVVSPALRAAAIQLGRGYARLIGRLWPGRRETVALLELGAVSRPVAVGVAAALVGLDAAATARLVAYDDVQTACAAALKLRPMDPADSVGWFVEVAGDIEDLVDDVSCVATPEEIPATGAPLIEAWAEVHAVTQQRLFRA